MVLYTPGRTTSYDPTPVRSGLRLHFLGGGREVGNVGCVLEDSTGTRLLIDYGLAPTRTHRPYRDGAMACRLPWYHIAWKRPDCKGFQDNVVRHIQGFQHRGISSGLGQERHGRRPRRMATASDGRGIQGRRLGGDPPRCRTHSRGSNGGNRHTRFEAPLVRGPRYQG